VIQILLPIEDLRDELRLDAEFTLVDLPMSSNTGSEEWQEAVGFCVSSCSTKHGFWLIQHAARRIEQGRAIKPDGPAAPSSKRRCADRSGSLCGAFFSWERGLDLDQGFWWTKHAH